MDTGEQEWWKRAVRLSFQLAASDGQLDRQELIQRATAAMTAAERADFLEFTLLRLAHVIDQGVNGREIGLHEWVMKQLDILDG